MKKLGLLLCAFLGAMLLPSCVNDDYDLSEVEGGNTSLGSESAVIEMPLAKFEVTLDDLLGSKPSQVNSRAASFEDMSAAEILDEVNNWLAAAYLNGGEPIDIVRLCAYPEDSYLLDLIKTLFTEISTDDERIELIATMIWENGYLEYLEDGYIDTSSKEAFISDLKRLIKENVDDVDFENKEFLETLEDIADALSTELLPFLAEEQEATMDVFDGDSLDESAQNIVDALAGGDNANVSEGSEPIPTPSIEITVTGESTLGIGFDGVISLLNKSGDVVGSAAFSIKAKGEVVVEPIVIPAEALSDVLSGLKIAITGQLTEYIGQTDDSVTPTLTLSTSVKITSGNINFSSL